jgi:hypothetical protein
MSRDTVVTVGGTLVLAAGTSNIDLSPDGNKILGVRPLRRGSQLIAVPNWIVEYRERIAAAEKK